MPQTEFKRLHLGSNVMPRCLLPVLTIQELIVETMSHYFLQPKQDHWRLSMELDNITLI